MAIGSGLGASFGIAAESTFGTYVAPTRFFAGRSFNVKKVQNTQMMSGVAAGRAAPIDEVVTTTGATGQLQVDVLRKDFGLLFAHMAGSTATPVQQGATAAYLQTHVLSGDPYGRSLTIQAGMPLAAGTVQPYTATGCKVTGLELSCSVDGLLQATVDFDGRTWTDAQSLASPSYTASNAPFHFGEMSVRMGTFDSEASVDGVRSVSVKIARPMDTARYYAGAAGLKAQQVWNGFLEITGTVEVDHITKADFIDRFTGHTATSLVLEWVGSTAIASTYYPTVGVQLPRVYFNGDVPDVSGPEIIRASVPFKAFLDTTNGLGELTYMSTDAAV